MSEQRIKERCKREDIALKIIKGFLKKDCYTDTELEYSLNTLLELYTKQKEEIKELKRDYEIITDDMKNHNVVYTDMPEFEERYISKDKIKDKIKEYGEQRIKLADGHFFDNPDNTSNDFALFIGQEVLKELLEE